MKIIIFGASGKTGTYLVKQALEAGHMVSAFVRNPSKLQITHQNLKTIQGNIVDYNFVEKVIKDHDVVFSTLGAASPFKYDQSVVDGMGNIVKAMESTQVKRLVYMSAINVSESRGNAGIMI